VTDHQGFERAVDVWLADGSDRSPQPAVDAVLLAIKTTPQERDLRIQWRNPTMPAPMRLIAAFAIVAIGGVAVLSITGPATWLGSAPTPTLRTPAPLIWTPGAVKLDWPGPLRAETLASAGQVFAVADYVDDVGDNGAPQPWADITRVTTIRLATLELAGGLSRVPDAADSWIAYGVVIDLDGDGNPDQRIGIDNGTSDHREWITDLKTGETAVNESGIYGAFEAFGTRLETWFVDPDGIATILVKREPAGFRFYAWTSTISGGAIVATDFAPDAGWIETGR
jgi:hypothetical protein